MDRAREGGENTDLHVCVPTTERKKKETIQRGKKGIKREAWSEEKEESIWGI